MAMLEGCGHQNPSIMAAINPQPSYGYRHPTTYLPTYKQYNLEAVSAIGDLMVHLADLAGSLGGVKIGESIRKGKVFTERIVVSDSR